MSPDERCRQWQTVTQGGRFTNSGKTPVGGATRAFSGGSSGAGSSYGGGKKGAGVLTGSGDNSMGSSGDVKVAPAPKEVKVSKSKYPESYDHAVSTGNEKGPFTVDRAGRNLRRRVNLNGKEKVTGKDLDEFPPAVTKEGDDASVRAIDKSDNRGSGSTMGHQIKDLKDGDTFEYDWTE